jgi:hypothetical protein
MVHIVRLNDWVGNPAGGQAGNGHATHVYEPGEVFDCRGLVAFVLAGRQVSVIRARTAVVRIYWKLNPDAYFFLEQSLSEWVQDVRSIPGRRRVAGQE